MTAWASLTLLLKIVLNTNQLIINLKSKYQLYVYILYKHQRHNISVYYYFLKDPSNKKNIIDQMMVIID